MESFDDIDIILSKKSIDYSKYDNSISFFINNIIDGEINNNNKFAFPNISIFLSFLPIFTGKVNKKNSIIKNILDKKEEDLTDFEKLELEDYFNDLFVVEKTNSNEFKYRFFSSNFDLNTTLESDIDKVTLSKYITKVFGSEGMRHFLALIQGIDENGRTGRFESSINEHLEKLGYKREKTGSFNSRIKLVASNIIRILGSLQIEDIEYKNNKYSYNLKKIFTLKGNDINLDSNKNIIESKFEIIAEDWWYLNSFNSENPKYSKILKDIIFEDHKTNPITISLVPILSILWSDKKEFTTNVNELMNLCSLELSNKNFKDLVSELEYMKYRGYIKDFYIEKQTNNFLEYLVKIISPNWFNKSIEIIQKKEDKIINSKIKKLNWDDIEKILINNNISIEDLSSNLEVSLRTLYYLRSGVKPVSKKMSDKIISIFNLNTELNL